MKRAPYPEMARSPETPDDQEPQERASTQPIEQVKQRSQRKSMASVRRELDDNDLTSSAVQKLLLDDIDRLEDEKHSLLSYREKFHEVDKKNSVLEEKGKISLSQEIISSGCLSIGAAAIGYAPSVWLMGPTGWIILSFGVVVLVCGIVAKAVRT